MLASTIQISNNNPTPPPPPASSSQQERPGPKPHTTRPHTHRYVPRRSDTCTDVRLILQNPNSVSVSTPTPPTTERDGDTTTTPAAEPRTSGGVGLFPHL
jgi:hypothetical protein